MRDEGGKVHEEGGLREKGLRLSVMEKGWGK